MHRTVVLDVVGLSGRLLGPDTPNLSKLARVSNARPLAPVLPAVTCSVQSTFLTGALPRRHGIVGNGWYHRDISEVALWRQSNHLVSGEKIWEEGRRIDASFTCAKLFWWFNMYSSADVSVTPRPIYCADGRKIPDVYTEPAGLRDELTARLGTFPLFSFWGPNANLESTQWIAECARAVDERYAPTLSLVYLPHLDYALQKLGPNHPGIAAELRAVDTVCGQLLDHYARRDVRVIVLSEYGIVPVEGAVHVNRELRRSGLLRVREELGTDKLDAGASYAFAVADHQVAHVYVRDRGDVGRVRALLERLEGVERVLGEEEKRAAGLDHPRAGELVLVARPDRWFSYYFWLEDERAPDYARTVDIHRKPGYDPVELFVDPALRMPRARVLMRLAQKKLGLRYLMDVVPLDASLVKGSHGRIPDDELDLPVLLSTHPEALPREGHIAATDVKKIVLDHVFDRPAITSRAPTFATAE